MKYVIGSCKSTGWIYPIVFDNQLVHAEAAAALPRGAEIIGAGICDVHGHVAGFSDSLNIGPSAHDSLILYLFLQRGLSGLQLHNQLLYHELQHS